MEGDGLGETPTGPAGSATRTPIESDWRIQQCRAGSFPVNHPDLKGRSDGVVETDDIIEPLATGLAGVADMDRIVNVLSPDRFSDTQLRQVAVNLRQRCRDWGLLVAGRQRMQRGVRPRWGASILQTKPGGSFRLLERLGHGSEVEAFSSSLEVLLHLVFHAHHLQISRAMTGRRRHCLPHGQRESDNSGPEHSDPRTGKPLPSWRRGKRWEAKRCVSLPPWPPVSMLGKMALSNLPVNWTGSWDNTSNRRGANRPVP